MKRWMLLTMLAVFMPIAAQTPAAPDALNALSFLEGTWLAKASGADGKVVSGRGTFQRELGGHILARHSTNDPGCKGPVTFDCEHGDLLYIFQDAPGQPLKAIYFDNEGHVLHYDVTIPSATSVVFLTQPGPGPRFRLLYEVKDGVMYGKFQIQMPGAVDWRSYLEWSGGKA